MSTYSKSDKSEETQGVVSVIQKILVEMGKSPSTYKKYAEETVKEVLKEIEKGEIYWKMDFDNKIYVVHYE